MITFNNLNNEKPYQLLKKKYHEALSAGQKNIEAISISSYNIETQEVDSRYVNLKFINNNEFIFFTNYNSPKSIAFSSHDQISALIYWPSINVQIRMKARIQKTSNKFNQEYFKNRSKDKNALAISSNQSSSISSFDQVIKKYNKIKKDRDLKICPQYWGGFSFTPYEIEFWEGNASRLNKRNFYKLNKNIWHHFILEP
tara:strand:+ start:10881 stop:11477 length:597 start_codon:yes stop_codon:yes gene_type:complete